MEKGTHNGQQTCYLAPPSGEIKTLQLDIWRLTKEPETSCAQERKKLIQESKVILLVLNQPFIKLAFTVTLLIMSKSWCHRRRKNNLTKTPRQAATA